MRSILILLTGFYCLVAQTQLTTDQSLYDPGADAHQQIERAVEKAGLENKHVLIQVGGNWCSWCRKLHAFIAEHESIDSLIHADYVLIRVNFSKENKNMDVMQDLEYPNRFGFPVLVVLNSEGRKIHTQQTDFLEDNDTFSEEKIREFLLNWNAKAMNPATYKE
jgi:thiol:disulfide interchange protein